MKIKAGKRILYDHTARAAVAQLLGIGLCTAVLLLFVALTYSRITLPHYTAKYNQKDVQQVVNLLITVVATIAGILLNHCRRLTNEAETKCELRDERLTVPRLHIHFEAAGGSKLVRLQSNDKRFPMPEALGTPALYDRNVWSLVAVYFLAMVVFGFLHSVLSVIFVIDGIIGNQGVPRPVTIPLSSEIPWLYKGQNIDACAVEISSPACYYELANTALSSQLITYLPYTIGGVTFEPPNGTMGLPFWAMQHFSDEVSNSTFDEEHRQYCLPVLDPHVIRCKEDPFDQELLETISNGVRYHPMVVFANDNSSSYTAGGANEVAAGMYAISIPKDVSVHDNDNIKFRTSDQNQGTMCVRMNPHKEFWNTTYIAASDQPGVGRYASLLYELMYGVSPDPSLMTGPPSARSFFFVAKCEIMSIMHRDNFLSSWRKVNFVFKNGVSRANVTEERCPNPRGKYTSGFRDLYFDLEGASAVLSSTDGKIAPHLGYDSGGANRFVLASAGYPKLFNFNNNASTGTHYYQNMSRLDAIVNQMYAITQTGWSGSNFQYAKKTVPQMYSHPVMMIDYPHLYVIRIDWTPTTWIGLVLSLLITINAFILAARWARATYSFRRSQGGETWNLLRPVDLMAYSLASYQDLANDLGTVDSRREVMRGRLKTKLSERPLDEGTQSLIQLVNGEAKRTGSSSTSLSGMHSSQDIENGTAAGEDAIKNATRVSERQSTV